MKKNFYVSTPIYYPNNNLHIGHAYTTVLADIIARYKKSFGYNVYFVTGSDEHGQKIYVSALKEKKDTRKFVDNIIKNFKELWKELEINYDHFIRTTDEKHMQFVKNIFNELLKKGEIYKGVYTGLYCIHDEEFFTKSQAKNNLCPNCGRELQKISEEAYFLKVSKYKKWIESALKNDDILLPKTRVNELLKNFVKDLQDLSITRKNVNWGIKINNESDDVIYVWFDALLNYLSTLTYDKSNLKINDVWSKNSNTEILQIIGKEITRFHAIYWPIILKMLNYREPKILSHGWIIDDSGDKMSKSKNNAVSPIELIKKYGKDSIRFYLINGISIGEDGKFSENLLIKNINGVLVNKYSNLINRTTKLFLKKRKDGVIPKRENNKIKIINSTKENLNKIKNNYIKEMNNYSFHQASKSIIKYLDELNNYFDKSAIWKIEDKKKLDNHFNFLFNEIWNLSILFSPILIDSTREILKMYKEKEISFAKWDKDFSNIKIKNIDILFKRLK